tara:strand:+ start:302 stop:1099 length:798 start_codon:yes stop_codon:yes gene_type:complete
MKNNKIVLFDMDGTLTLPREKIQHDMIRSLRDLSLSTKIGIVTGSDFEYVMQQCGDMFDLSGVPVNRIDIFPCNGTKHYKWANNKFNKVSEVDMIEKISLAKYKMLLQTLLSFQLMITLKHDVPYTGTFFDYRGSTINWCPIGRSADKKERKAWVAEDEKYKIRNYFMKEVTKFFKEKDIDLKIALGGSTSFDIYPTGWDKTYVISHLAEYDNIYFVGDRCGPGGNDYELYQMISNIFPNNSFITDSTASTIKIIETIKKEQQNE